MSPRIVSLVPSITENLILFGCKPVGRTSFCIFPKEKVKDIPVIGGTKTPKISKIVGLQPELVIGNQEENRKEDVEALEAAGLKVWVTYPRKVKDVVPLMDELEKICGQKEISRPMIDRATSEIETIHAQKPSRALKVLALIWKDPWMASGRDTYIGDLIETSGGANVVEDPQGRYPQLSDGELLTLAPDLILLPSEPYEFTATHQAEMREFFTQNGQTPRIELVSGEDISWSGPRVGRGLKAVQTLLHSMVG